MLKSLTAAERETVVLFSDADDTAQITTAQRRIITKLRKNPAATEIDTQYVGSTESATFTLPAGLVSFRSARRKGGRGNADALAAHRASRSA